jgi:hypothetical protein
VAHAAAILDAVVALDESAGDEAVDHAGDAGPAHRELVGEGGRGLVTFAEEDQHAVLREAELYGRERQFDLAGETSHDPAGPLR